MTIFINEQIEWVERFNQRKTVEYMIDGQNVMEAILETLKSVQWRPISEAPDNGGVVLLCKQGFQPTVGYKAVRSQKWWNIHILANRGVLSYAMEPTHFMPLPAPPEKEKKDE